MQIQKNLACTYSRQWHNIPRTDQISIPNPHRDRAMAHHSSHSPYDGITFHTQSRRRHIIPHMVQMMEQQSHSTHSQGDGTSQSRRWRNILHAESGRRHNFKHSPDTGTIFWQSPDYGTLFHTQLRWWLEPPHKESRWRHNFPVKARRWHILKKYKLDWGVVGSSRSSTLTYSQGSHKNYV